MRTLKKAPDAPITLDQYADACNYQGVVRAGEVEAALGRYCVALGGTFQSADFHRWLIESKQEPDGLDLRVIGGLMVRRVQAGIVTKVGYRPDAPVKHGSSARPIWRIDRLEALEPARHAGDFAEREKTKPGRAA